jgi:hypothetical protein
VVTATLGWPSVSRASGTELAETSMVTPCSAVIFVRFARKAVWMLGVSMVAHDAPCMAAASAMRNASVIVVTRFLHWVKDHDTRLILLVVKELAIPL